MEGRRVLVTGGLGFLGSHFVRRALERGAARVVNLDLVTYAGDPMRLSDVEGDSRYEFRRTDVTSDEAAAIIASERPDLVVHYAAESHVTRSEKAPDLFFRTNVDGTRNLLEAAIGAGVDRFVHISTDEVYGPILSGAFREEGKGPGEGAASSAYARSKALSDDLARSFGDRIPVIVARPTNAFGPYQFPEKAFARWVTRALRGEMLPVWGDGLYVRQWLNASNFASAIQLLAESGTPGEVYNVGPRHEPEITNLALTEWLVSYLGVPKGRIEMTAYDRPGHDRRYAVDSSKIEALGWRAGDVWRQFADTVEWYRSNRQWWERHIREAESIYTEAKS